MLYSGSVAVLVSMLNTMFTALLQKDLEARNEDPMVCRVMSLMFNFPGRMWLETRIMYVMTFSGHLRNF